MAVETSLKNGLEGTVRELQEHRQAIDALPESGVPGQLRDGLSEEIAHISDRLSQFDFHKHASDLSSSLTTLKARTRDAALQMADSQKHTIRESQEDLQRLSEWAELTQEEQAQTVSKLEELLVEATEDPEGLKKLLRQEYVIASNVSELKKQIEQLGQKRRLERLEEEKAKAKKEGRKKLSRTLHVPSAVESAAQLEELIRQLQELKAELALYTDIEVNFKIED